MKELRNNRSNRNKTSKRRIQKLEDDTTSEDESERPKRKFTPHPELYCWYHGSQKTHSSSTNCKVMAADTDQLNQHHHQEATPEVMDEKNEVQGRSLLQKHLPPPSPPIVNSILRHKRKNKPETNGKAYAIHDDLSTADDNNNYIPELE
jgi:hypothetical protein